MGFYKKSETDSIPVLAHDAVSRHSGIFTCSFQIGKKIIFWRTCIAFVFTIYNTSIVKAKEFYAAMYHSLNCRKEHSLHIKCKVVQWIWTIQQYKFLNKNSTFCDDSILMKQWRNLDVPFSFLSCSFLSCEKSIRTFQSFLPIGTYCFSR